MGTNKCSADGAELNTVITLALDKLLKIKKNSKGKPKDVSKSDYNNENFNFEKM